MDDDARLIEIETRLAFQDRTIEALNEVVLGLRDDISRLRQNLSEVREKIEAADAEVGGANERPPHW